MTDEGIAPPPENEVRLESLEASGADIIGEVHIDNDETAAVNYDVEVDVPGDSIEFTGQVDNLVIEEFTLTPDEAGDVLVRATGEVGVQDVYDDEYVFVEPDPPDESDIFIDTFSLNDSSAEPGQTVTADLDFFNNADVEVEIVMEIIVDGLVASDFTVELRPGFSYVEDDRPFAIPSGVSEGDVDVCLEVASVEPVD